MKEVTRNQNKIREMILDMKLPNEVAELQLKKRNIFYDKFLIYNSLNDYSNEDFGYIKMVGGHWIDSMEQETQRFIYKFPNGYGVAVARGMHTEGCWNVWEFRYDRVYADSPIHVKIKHNNKKLDVTEVANSLELLPSSHTGFSAVEGRLKAMYAFHPGKLSILTKVKNAYIKRKYRIDI